MRQGKIVSGEQRPFDVVVVGSFFPEYQMAGNSTTGLVYLLHSLIPTSRVRVLAQSGARRPNFMDRNRVEVISSWKYDNPVSVIAMLFRALRLGRTADAILINTYVTAFGRHKVSNGVGLISIAAVSKLVRCPIVVYLHNLSVTQQIHELGYDASPTVRFVARMIEGLLVKTGKVLVPLDSQSEAIRKSFGVNVPSLLIPSLECVGREVRLVEPRQGGVATGRARRRILLFGAWGPQKDLAGSLAQLSPITTEREDTTLTVAGGVNEHFPSYREVWNGLKSKYSGPRIVFVGPVPEERVAALVAEHDLLVLPYNATGGYSGGLSVAGFTNTPVVAYDLPQLREHASLIGATVTFVSPEGESLHNAVVSVLESSGSCMKTFPTVEHLELTRRKFEELKRLLFGQTLGIRGGNQ